MTFFILALLALCAECAVAGVSIVRHDLRIRLDLERRELTGEDHMEIAGDGEIAIRLWDRFRTTRIAAAALREVGRNRWVLPSRPGKAPRRVRVQYRGLLDPLVRADYRGVLGALPPMADARGTYLPAGSGWYPEVEAQQVAFQVTLDLPAGQRGLVPGTPLGSEERGGRSVSRFAFETAPEPLALIAGPYELRQRHRRIDGRDIALQTYFHREVATLSDGYLDAVGQYLERYGRLIGPYPFEAFSVVSSPLPTGFGMPTLTYLGVDVLRLPFIRGTSLGHEVLHSWWGNGVLVDPAQGNWCEGLTTFMADYAYAEDAGPEAARAMRLEWLRDFFAVPQADDFPLARFQSRRHGASQAIGYHKAAFLFFMLRDHVGQTAFADGLRRFWGDHRGRPAGWEELRAALEASSGQQLGTFFDQWLRRTGAPRVQLEAAAIDAASGRIRVTVAQDAPAYALRVPLVVETDAGPATRIVEMTDVRREVGLDVAGRPRSVALDPEFTVFRRLAPEEAPPILRQVMLDPATVTVIPSGDRAVQAAARRLAQRLLDHQPRVVPVGAALPHAPLLMLGLREEVNALLTHSRVPGASSPVHGRGTAAVWATRSPQGHPILVVAAESAAALDALTTPLPHYGRQSHLVFEGSRVIEQGVAPARPATIPIRSLP